MQQKIGIKLYLKQWVARHGSLSSHCYQLVREAKLSNRDMREAVRAGLELYEERQRRFNGRQAA